MQALTCTHLYTQKHARMHTHIHAHMSSVLYAEETEAEIIGACLVLKTPRPRCETQILEASPDSYLHETGISQNPILGFQTKNYVRLTRESQA